jgi:hypothetical protein
VVEIAIDKFKIYKLAGVDQIPAELTKASGNRPALRSA